MGSISSRPKAPAPQPTVIYTYVPQEPVYVPPAQTPAPIVTAPDTSNGGGTTTPEPEITEEAKSAARAEGLLNRNRGVLGTVMTSFRGLLGQSQGSARKTLLGE